MKYLLTFLLCFGLLSNGADIDVYQTNGTKKKVTMSGGATISTSGAVTLSGAGTVSSVAATVPAFMSIAGSPVTTSGTLAFTLSGTALPVANGGTGITSFGTGIATFLGTPSSANLASALTDETGSGAAVFGTSPTVSAPSITGHPTIEGVTSTGATGTGNLVFSAAATHTGGLTVNGFLGGTWQTFTQGTGTVTVATTAYVDITGLSASIGANETWVYHVFCPVTGATNGCLFQVTGPASPTAVQIYVTANVTTLAALTHQTVSGFSTPTTAAAFSNATTNEFVEMTILVVNGSNAGTVQVQFATASGTNTCTAQANRFIDGARKN